MRGSLVNLYNFDNSTNKGSDKGTDKGAVIAVRPSLNSINNKKQSKPIKQERVKSKFSPPSIDQVKEEKALLSKTETRTESSASRRTKFVPPAINEVTQYFLDLKSTVSEGENFHNYFESNGWLVGGKAKMQNWQAAARNWIKRSGNFNKSSTAKERLHTNDDKEYATPL